MEADGTPEDRLEEALERIAKIVDVRHPANSAEVGSVANHVEALPDQAATELADRLDRIIDTLRDALGK